MGQPDDQYALLLWTELSIRHPGFTSSPRWATAREADQCQTFPITGDTLCLWLMTLEFLMNDGGDSHKGGSDTSPLLGLRTVVMHLFV